MSAEKQSEGIEESWAKIQSGDMPLQFYIRLHPSAKLSPADRAILQTWASAGGAAADTGAGLGSGTGTGRSANTPPPVNANAVGGGGRGGDSDGDGD
jgi:hypothetical protein